ncbi:sensor histidine kinase [Chenggangzhangella methanolivorans]|uniref:histidine kinase n=1 Tax=Chenggangzhangella methanolivorans TaxID=1437009 RepID=A0A9E6RCA6_9HYPH|nr:ATP-binding protein [Chenggangzhangella methanolivorans]QZO01690.1 GHKL domain-containing protein [Chenggangzhangella methanolivorans]
MFDVISNVCAKGVAHSARVAMLGELSASIAHEISQPITAITTNASTLERVLQQKNLNLEFANGVSQRLQRDAMRVRDIIQRIRTLAANQEVQFEPVNLDTVVSDTITLLAHELQEHEVALTKSNRVSAPIVIGDRVQLQQVMVNLIMNAIQAMHACPPRNRRVQIELVEADHRLMICVTDSGVGFPDGAASEMFESFRSTKQGGLGLGLAICRSIVEAHGGSLTAGNRLDEPGAVLRVSLPAAPSE